MGSGAWRHLPALQPGPEDAAISLETASFINSLVETWPDGSSDTVSQGDDHIRLLKASIKRTFPNIAGEVSVSSGEINMLKYVPQWLSCEVNGSSISAVSILKNITFTGNDNKVSGNPANMYWVDTGAGTDGGRWRIGATGGDLLLQARDDSNSAATTFLSFVRSGLNVTEVRRVFTVATLPSAVNGGVAFVSDATATTFASIVAGGGSNRVPVYSDGTNWRIG